MTANRKQAATLESLAESLQLLLQANERDHYEVLKIVYLDLAERWVHDSLIPIQRHRHIGT
jgi:hypothetical protein